MTVLHERMVTSSEVLFWLTNNVGCRNKRKINKEKELIITMEYSIYSWSHFLECSVQFKLSSLAVGDDLF